MKIDANGTEIRVMGDVVNEEAYISLTDIAKYKNPDNAFIVVANWMRNHSTISFLGLWEQIHNPNFKPIEFDRFKAESGDNAFTLTPQQWIKATDATGIISISGRLQIKKSVRRCRNNMPCYSRGAKRRIFTITDGFNLPHFAPFCSFCDFFNNIH